MGTIENVKDFFEVFPTLKMPERLQNLFQNVKVRKITTNSRRDFLHVYIHSTHVIQKKFIFLMEEQIQRQLFPDAGIVIKIKEKYTLSVQYTPQALMEEYRDSILLEFKETSILAASMFEQAHIRFEDGNVLCLELVNTVVSAGRQEVIVALLNEVFNERFQMETEIRVTYKDKESTSQREYDEQRIQREIDAIFRRSRQNKNEDAPENMPRSAGVSADEGKKGKNPSKASISISKKQAGTVSKSFSGNKDRSFKKKTAGDYKRPLKQEDDPNLIYGKNFDDEPVRLDQDLVEMTEIVYQGKVIAAETREIRNERTIVTFKVTDFTDTITAKIFVANEYLPEILGNIKKGAFLGVIPKGTFFLILNIKNDLLFSIKNNKIDMLKI